MQFTLDDEEAPEGAEATPAAGEEAPEERPEVAELRSFMEDPEADAGEAGESDEDEDPEVTELLGPADGKPAGEKP